jgi:signal transduction histidine kinase
MDGTVGVEPNTPSGSVFWLRLPKATTTVAA